MGTCLVVTTLAVVPVPTVTSQRDCSPKLGFYPQSLWKEVQGSNKVWIFPISVWSIDSTDMRNMKVNPTWSRTFTLKSVLAEDVSNDDVNTAARSVFWIKTHRAFMFQKSKLWVSRHSFDATAVLIYVFARGFGWRGWHILQSSTWRKAIKIGRPVFESGTRGNKTLAFPRLLMWLFCPIKLCRLVISNKTFCWSKKAPAKSQAAFAPATGQRHSIHGTDFRPPHSIRHSRQG